MTASMSLVTLNCSAVSFLLPQLAEARLVPALIVIEPTGRHKRNARRDVRRACNARYRRS